MASTQFQIAWFSNSMYARWNCQTKCRAITFEHVEICFNQPYSLLNHLRVDWRDDSNTQNMSYRNGSSEACHLLLARKYCEQKPAALREVYQATSQHANNRWCIWSFGFRPRFSSNQVTWRTLSCAIHVSSCSNLVKTGHPHPLEMYGI